MISSRYNASQSFSSRKNPSFVGLDDGPLYLRHIDPTHIQQKESHSDGSHSSYIPLLLYLLQSAHSTNLEPSELTIILRSPKSILPPIESHIINHIRMVEVIRNRQHSHRLIIILRCFVTRHEIIETPRINNHPMIHEPIPIRLRDHGDDFLPCISQS